MILEIGPLLEQTLHYGMVALVVVAVVALIGLLGRAP